MVDKNYIKCLRIAHEESIFSAFIKSKAFCCSIEEKEKIVNLYYFLKKQELIDNQQILSELAEEFDFEDSLEEEYEDKTLAEFLPSLDFTIKNCQFLANNVLEHLNNDNLIIKNEN